MLTAGKHKIKNIVQGNAHRGRFNTLTKMFGVPYELIFAEFMDIPNKNWRYCHFLFKMFQGRSNKILSGT